MDELFPSEINSEELDAGFIQAEVKNYKAHYYGQPPTLQVVIFPVDKSHRIIKMRDPQGQVTYKLQVFGTFKHIKGSDPDWLPVGMLFDFDPAKAIQRVNSQLALAESVLSGPPINIADAPANELGHP